MTEVELELTEVKALTVAVWERFHKDAKRKGKFYQQGSENRGRINDQAKRLYGTYLDSSGCYHWTIVDQKAKIVNEKTGTETVKILRRVCAGCSNDVARGETTVHPSIWNTEKNVAEKPDWSVCYHVCCLSVEDWAEWLGHPISGHKTRKPTQNALTDANMLKLMEAGQLELFGDHTVQSAVDALRKSRGMAPVKREEFESPPVQQPEPTQEERDQEVYGEF